MKGLYALLDRLGGLRRGHTRFKTGDHGDGWIEKGALLSEPARLTAVLEAQAGVIRERFSGAEVVVGSSECGSALAAMVAARAGLRVAFTKRDGKGRYGFHRMFRPDRGSAVVLVDDLVFSGRDVRDHATFFRRRGLGLKGISVWCARSTADTAGLEIDALMPHPFKTYRAEDCPLCAADAPLAWTGIRE